MAPGGQYKEININNKSQQYFNGFFLIRYIPKA